MLAGGVLGAAGIGSSLIFGSKTPDADGSDAINQAAIDAQNPNTFGDNNLVLDGKTPDVDTPNDNVQQLNAAGSARLGRVFSGATQLSDAWISEVLDKLPNSSPSKQAILQARDNGNLRAAVGGVDKDSKKLVIAPVKVDSPDGDAPPIRE